MLEDLYRFVPVKSRRVVVLNGSTEPTPTLGSADTLRVTTNMVDIRRWKRDREDLFSLLVTSGPAATLIRQYEEGTPTEVLETNRRHGVPCVQSTTTARGQGRLASRS